MWCWNFRGVVCLCFARCVRLVGAGLEFIVGKAEGVAVAEVLAVEAFL